MHKRCPVYNKRRRYMRITYLCTISWPMHRHLVLIKHGSSRVTFLLDGPFFFPSMLSLGKSKLLFTS